MRWVLCLVAACWTGPAPRAPTAPEPAPTAEPRARSAEPPRTRLEQMMFTLGDFTDRMCACGDKPCADAVTDDYTKWGQEMAQHRIDASDKPTDEQTKQMTETIKRYASCMAAAMTAGNPCAP